MVAVIIIKADGPLWYSNAIASCVVLHNICEQLGDACWPERIHTDSEAPVAPAQEHLQPWPQVLVVAMQTFGIHNSLV